MSLTVQAASVAVFARAMTNLSAILEKAKASGAPEAELIEARLADDMRPLPFQVQSASDSAKGCVARLAGIEPPSMPDTETTLDQLQDRLARTIAFVQSVDASKLEGAETRQVTLPLPGGAMNFSGEQFLFGFALPNFFFHVTTAYAILRHKGVQIGKMDYLGGAQS